MEVNPERAKLLGKVQYAWDLLKHGGGIRGANDANCRF